MANCAERPDPSNSTGHRFPMLLGTFACTAAVREIFFSQQPIQAIAVRQRQEATEIFAQEM
jgi:hypothetical protein